MVRLARFSADAFLAAAVAIVAESGPSAATMGAIARRSGAPTGSIYHRFESRAALLATAWTGIHGAFVEAVAPSLRAGDALRAALAITGWARGDADAARFLLLNESGALFDGAPLPDPLRAEIRRQEEELDAAFQACLAAARDRAAARMERQDGGKPPDGIRVGVDEAAARARFLVFDGPIALLRPYLLAGTEIPGHVDRMIAEMHGAVPVAPALAAVH
ncbi:TetR/AcrR family transcriptional regulator [Arenibaculum pallidiluteum]|uniref:TetR/AcrR family transcriptional regulator n=1 Tax=Arenibaculum pallidiluteum TaxID=2812559 RepID=UPI001A959F76|nr:TetR/AcrR family transcriptional regulator [Arenibaculum pallidiluteum]